MFSFPLIGHREYLEFGFAIDWIRLDFCTLHFSRFSWQPSVDNDDDDDCCLLTIRNNIVFQPILGRSWRKRTRWTKGRQRTNGI